MVFIEDHTNHNIPLSQSLVQQVPAAAKLLQSCPTLCNPIDGSSPGYPVPGILQARTLEWVVGVTRLLQIVLIYSLGFCLDQGYPEYKL